MRWFKRKKKEEPKVEEETPTQSVEQSTMPPSTIPSEEILHTITDPVPAFIRRIEGILTEPDIVSNTKALKATRIQLIVGGEPLLLSKVGVQSLTLSRERSTQTDVFIRISEKAAEQLAMTTTLAEFKKEYKTLVGVTGASSYVTIKLHTPLDALRSQGYFSIEFLRILIDA